MSSVNSPRRGSGKYDLIPSNNSDYDEVIPNSPRSRSKLTSRGIISSLLIISFFGFAVSFARQSGSEIDLGFNSGNRWSKLKEAGWGGNSAEEMAEMANTQAAELALELATKVINPTIELQEEEEYILRKKRIFSKHRSKQVAKQLEEGALSKYNWHAELQGYSGNSTSDPRLIIVGDIHGTHESATTLLARLSYSQSSDILLHVGDLVSKSPLADSLETVRLLRTLKAQGVRGNHDQGVIEWRNWMLAYGNTKIDKSSSEELYTATGGVGADKYKLPVGNQLTKRRGMSIISSLNKGFEVPRLAKRRGMSIISGLNQDLESPRLAKRRGVSIIAGLNKGWKLTKRRGISIISGLNKGLKKRKGISLLANLQKASSKKLQYITPSKYSKVKFPSSPSLSTTDKIDRNDLAKKGALLGPGWEWLNADFDDLKKMGVVVPEEWSEGSSVWGGNWFEIARHLPEEDYEYLENLPLTLHLKDFNSYLVHAGMLPGDFEHFTSTTSHHKHKPDEKLLPLPALLNSTSAKTFKPPNHDSALFSTFEREILLVKENVEPFTLLDMRALLGSGTKDDDWVVTKKKLGIPWNQIWNQVMEECESEEFCTPINVIYGHWKGRGLEILPNTFGLDSGCVYGNRLSSLVISPIDSDSSPLAKPQTLSLENFKASTTKSLIGEGGKSSSKKVEVLEGLWRPGGISSINKEMENDGIPIAGKRQVESKQVKGEVSIKDVNDQFDDLPVVINGRKSWVISVACPDLEGKSNL